MNEKKLSLIGMIGSTVLVLLGILFMTGLFGGNTYVPNGASSYSSGYASFGADFYTYVSNNAAEAAYGSIAAASNLESIAGLLKILGGLVIMSFGLLGFCHFGISYTKFKGQVQSSQTHTEDSYTNSETIDDKDNSFELKLDSITEK